MIRKTLHYFLGGIAYGCTVFVVAYVSIILVAREPTITISTQKFLENVVGCILCGLGFGTTSIVYTSYRLSFLNKLLIHFVIGMGIYLPTAFYLGWIPFYSVGSIISGVLGATLIFFVIWAFFYLYHRHEAKCINQRLRELEEENNKTV